MRQQNIVLFSSGISEATGLLGYVTAELIQRGYSCSYWRDLFINARDPANISLLKMLIKKIPTFDFAILICEGHDRMEIVRNGMKEIVPTMRDNVLFEIGLCTMALGLNRTILLTDGVARLPEDLTDSFQNPALKEIVYKPAEKESWTEAVGDTASYIEYISESLDEAAKNIDEYIQKTGDSLVPTVIGASVSTACGYMTNFVLRTLESIQSGFLSNGSKELLRVPDEKLFMHIILPERFTQETATRAQKRLHVLRKAVIPNARYRSLEFRYRMIGDELHIYDYPTTLVTSYQTAQLILRMDADDLQGADRKAKERFNAKELDLFASAMQALISPKFIRLTIDELYTKESKEYRRKCTQRLIRLLPRITIEKKSY